MHFKVQEVVCFLSLPSSSPTQEASSRQSMPKHELGNRPSGDFCCCCCDYYSVVVAPVSALKECNHHQEQISEQKLHFCRSSHHFPFLFIFLSRHTRGSEQKSDSVPMPCPHPKPVHQLVLLGHPYHHGLYLSFCCCTDLQCL